MSERRLNSINFMATIRTATSVAAMLGLLTLSASPAFADSITVTNENSATITNSVNVTADSGGNTSTGAMGARGARGGDATGTRGSLTAGDGGAGGSGGSGGMITTGEAIATVVIENDINTTTTEIEDMDSDEDEFNETLDITWDRGTSTETSSKSHSSASNNSDDDGSASNSENQEEDYNNSKSHDDLTSSYTRTYVGSDSVLSVRNANTAEIGNGVTVAAMSGENHSTGEDGEEGGHGGNATSSGSDDDDGGSLSAGDGAAGGDGGSGGEIRAGRADSLVEIVNTTGRTITRIIRGE
jgi:hypothetical protein